MLDVEEPFFCKKCGTPLEEITAPGPTRKLGIWIKRHPITIDVILALLVGVIIFLFLPKEQPRDNSIVIDELPAVDETQMQTPPKAAPEKTAPKVDVVVFSSFDKEEAEIITEKILSVKDIKYGAFIKFISISGVSDRTAISDSIDLNATIVNHLTNSKKADFLNARTMFNQVVNYWSGIKDADPSMIFFLGSFPMPTEDEIQAFKDKNGAMINKSDMESFSSKDNIHFILRLKGEPEEFEIERYIYEEFLDMSLNVSIL